MIFFSDVSVSKITNSVIIIRSLIHTAFIGLDTELQNSFVTNHQGGNSKKKIIAYMYEISCNCDLMKR